MIINLNVIKKIKDYSYRKSLIIESHETRKIALLLGITHNVVKSL